MLAQQDGMKGGEGRMNYETDKPPPSTEHQDGLQPASPDGLSGRTNNGLSAGSRKMVDVLRCSSYKPYPGLHYGTYLYPYAEVHSQGGK